MNVEEAPQQPEAAPPTLVTVYQQLMENMNHHDAIKYMMQYTTTPEEMTQLLTFAARFQPIEHVMD